MGWGEPFQPRGAAYVPPVSNPPSMAPPDALMRAPEPIPQRVLDGGPSVEVRAVQRWTALDLWLALGGDSQAFEALIEQAGWADTWAMLLDAVRGRLRLLDVVGTGADQRVLVEAVV